MRNSQPEAVEKRKKVYIKPSVTSIFTEEVNAGFLIFNSEKIQIANTFVERMTGYQKSELQSMNFVDLFQPSFRELVMEKISGFISGNEATGLFEAMAQEKSGQPCWVKVQTSTFQNGNQKYIIVKITKNEESNQH